MILAALLFIAPVANTTTVSRVTDDYIEEGRVHILQDKDIPYCATYLPNPRPVPVRRDGQNLGRDRKHAHAAADCDYPAAQHDDD